MIQMHQNDASDEAIGTEAEVEIKKVRNGLKARLHLVRELWLDK